jgi:hypothetical protein
MSAATTGFREAKASPLCAPKSASREIFSRRGRAARRKPAYALAALRKNRCTYDEARQDRQSLQTDPIGYEDGLNLYMYVGDDPLNGIDPTGSYFLTCDAEGNCTRSGRACEGNRPAHYCSFTDNDAAVALLWWNNGGRQAVETYAVIETGRGLWMLGKLGRAGYLALRLRAVTLDDVLANPNLLRGLGQEALEKLRAEATRRGWRVEVNREGTGLRIYNPRGDQQIRFQPGRSGHHPEFENGYWVVSSGLGGTRRVRIGDDSF